MVKELARAVETKNRSVVLDSLEALVDVDMPKALLDKEAKNLMDRAVQNLQQQGMKAEDVNMEASQFEDEAKKRVTLGLVLGDIIKEHALEATEDDVNAYIADQASSYDDPAEVVNWYAENPNAKNEIRAILVEAKAAEKILSEAKITEVTKKFDDVISPSA